MKNTLTFIVLILEISFNFSSADSLEDEFINPPLSARPGVYWYFMDGNLNRDEMTNDLESMKEAGLGNLVFLEVDVGVPRGPVKFMSEEWQDMFAHTVHEAERLDIDITLGSGPGWTGSGGPWVKPEQSMQHLVFSEVDVTGPKKYDAVLPVPEQRSTEWHFMRDPFYIDIVAYAFPRCEPTISDINEKALFERDPYTSKPGVKPYLPVSAHYNEPNKKDVISMLNMIDITGYLEADGRLRWDVPDGEWIIVRMGTRSTGASTRPAPLPGVGLECDKFDAAALDEHFKNYYGKLLQKVGKRNDQHGWTTIHMDSWEMGAQNWTDKFADEFKNRRGYDLKLYLPTFTGRVVESTELSERFLWDIRITAQELVLENHAIHLKKLGDRYGFELSIEPYDMNPTADLELGAVADVPMAEFWSAGYGFDSSFSCFEATSIAHTMGRPIVSAEAFTADGSEGWQQYPWSMKNQGDWAFCIGINRFVYHTFAHKPLGDEYRPGMTMGPYGVHWDRGQTWWPLIKDYHRYITRCSNILRQGITVSDILYLTPEGAPYVFTPPPDAVDGIKPLIDKKGYGFDGCSPGILMARAEVKNGRIVFPNGTSYELMVLPHYDTMTPELLKRIGELVKAGATIIGSPPVKSPSLSDYPKCDKEVQALAQETWGSLNAPKRISRREYGKGYIYWGGAFSQIAVDTLYPSYADIAALLREMNVSENFTSTGPVRYTHRSAGEREIYFVSNKTDTSIKAECTFRAIADQPELWNPVTGERRILPQYTVKNGQTTIPMEFAPYESYFVVFSRKNLPANVASADGKNFPEITPVMTLDGSWDIFFNPEWGGPENITFDTLQDWTKREERGIMYYSGIARYSKVFDLPQISDNRIYLELGTVHDIAGVTVNGKDLGTVWCAPWRIEITSALKTGENRLEIEVANRWPNRLIGDMTAPDANFRTVQWSSGLLSGKEYKTGRYTFTTGEGFKNLLPSGLLGPVRIMVMEN